MKRIDLMITTVLLFFSAALLAVGAFLREQERNYQKEYLVEVNRIMWGMEEQGVFSMPDLQDCRQITAVTFLPREDMEDVRQAEVFFGSESGSGVHIEPLLSEGEICGFVRFDYQNIRYSPKQFWFLEGILMFGAVFSLTVLVYIRNVILRPFERLSNIPLELSKGHLEIEVKENKNRFFGKFLWGISMLRDYLAEARQRTLKLEKEKKMFLLSLSHDIKTPLSNISLYAKAIKDGLYDTEEEKRRAAAQIEALSGEIEGFVSKIAKTSEEEILPIHVENTEFYLKELAERIRRVYEPKCRLVMTDFRIGDYRNRMLKGSVDGAFEVVGNVMENALKYGDGRQIEITFYEEEYHQIIRIRNSGQPVRAEEIPHLFDSFYRGSNTKGQEGNGLGLYICREIMRKMEGEIFAEVRPDGMSFQIVFSF